MGIISTDTSKAFDSLLSALMIRKLEAYKFSKQSLTLLRSYFEQRLVRVKLGTVTSEWQKIKKGCPKDLASDHSCGTFSRMTCSFPSNIANYLCTQTITGCIDQEPGPVMWKEY